MKIRRVNIPLLCSREKIGATWYDSRYIAHVIGKMSHLSVNQWNAMRLQHNVTLQACCNASCYYWQHRSRNHRTSWLSRYLLHTSDVGGYRCHPVALIIYNGNDMGHCNCLFCWGLQVVHVWYYMFCCAMWSLGESRPLRGLSNERTAMVKTETGKEYD